MRKYEEYKASEIEWLGNIPETWDLKKIKWMTSIKRGASPRPIDDPKYFDEEGEYAWVRIADVSSAGMYLEKTVQSMSELGASLSVKREPGDIFVSIAGTVGKPCITNIKCCIHDGFVYFPEYKGNKKYLYYIFESGEPYKGLGKMGTQLNLNTETIGSIKIPNLPLSLQSKISRFLDIKINEVERLLNLKKKQIDILEQQRQSIITEAVTKGLNPNMKMKDSSVEWIGEIPEHWEVKKLKHLGKFVSGYAFPSNAFINDGIKVMKINNIQTMNLDWSDISYVAVDWLDKLNQYQIRKGDLVIALTRPIISTGIKAAIVDTDEELLLNQRNAYFRNNKLIPSNWLYYLVLNQSFVEEFESLIDRTGQQPNISTNDIENIKIPLPSLEEIQQITDYLNGKINDIEKNKVNILSQIEKLKEYRQSLIYEAVTGKIDVRNLELN